MDPLQVSAQFVAYVWFTNREAGSSPTNEEAVRFAKRHWRTFLPLAHRGLGRLLLKIAEPRMARRQRTDRCRIARTEMSSRKLAVAS